MNLKSFSLTALLMSLSPFLCAADDSQPQDFSKANYQRHVLPLLQKYCYACHDSDIQKGKVDLQAYKTERSIITNRKTWIKVAELLSNREMPVQKKNKKVPQPSEQERLFLIKWVEYKL